MVEAYRNKAFLKEEDGVPHFSTPVVLSYFLDHSSSYFFFFFLVC